MTASAIELRAAARRHLVSGITPEQAVVLAVAELGGQPLDQSVFDDAAVSSGRNDSS